MSNEQIDEILKRAVRKARSEDSTAWHFNSDWHRDKIKALITERERLARIDELKDFRKQWHTLIRQEVHQDLNDRIATLEKEQERSKNDQL